MEYNFREIEKKWHEYWIANKVYKVEKNADKPKYYGLDMFPYPSGAGLHVGHPLGYIASDIYSRYKRLQGFNVLHPMGYDAYGLPAEQYAIQTGQHPEVTTKKNIARYREQMDKIGFSYDWNREIRTCDPEYYKWTQWAFIQMFNSYYCNDKKQARPISELVAAFEQSGTEGLNVACSGRCAPAFGRGKDLGYRSLLFASDMCGDVVVDIAHGLELCQLFVRDGHAAGIFQSHVQLHGIQTVGLQILGQAGLHGHLVLVAVQGINNDLLHFFKRHGSSLL